jgi:hypothetical protein
MRVDDVPLDGLGRELSGELIAQTTCRDTNLVALLGRPFAAFAIVAHSVSSWSGRDAARQADVRIYQLER